MDSLVRQIHAGKNDCGGFVDTLQVDGRRRCKECREGLDIGTDLANSGKRNKGEQLREDKDRTVLCWTEGETRRKLRYKAAFTTVTEWVQVVKSHPTPLAGGEADGHRDAQTMFTGANHEPVDLQKHNTKELTMTPRRLRSVPTSRVRRCLQNTCVGFFLGALGSGVVFVVTWLFFGLFVRVLGRVFRDWVDHFSLSLGAAWDQPIDLCHFIPFKINFPLCVLPRPLLKPWRPSRTRSQRRRRPQCSGGTSTPWNANSVYWQIAGRQWNALRRTGPCSTFLPSRRRRVLSCYMTQCHNSPVLLSDTLFTMTFLILTR